MNAKTTTSILILLAGIFAGCGKSPENARKDLAALNIEYSPAAFAESIRKGDEVAVKLFLQSGIDVNANDGAALTAAIGQGSEPLVRDLLKRGAKPTSSNPQRLGPLEHAAAMGNLGMVKLLVEHGAEINPLQFEGYENALDIAEKNGKTEVANYFLKRFPVSKERANPAFLFAVLTDEPRLITRCVALGADLDYTNEDGETALGIAQEYELEKSLECLRELGAKASKANDLTATGEPSPTANVPPNPEPPSTQESPRTSNPETTKAFEGAVHLYKGKRYEDALKGFLAAAEKGHGQAQYNAGLMYAKGEGAEKDYVSAFKLFTSAKANGVEGAEQMRRKVLNAAQEDLDAAFGQVQVLQTSEGLRAAVKAKETYEELLKLERGL